MIKIYSRVNILTERCFSESHALHYLFTLAANHVTLLHMLSLQGSFKFAINCIVLVFAKTTILNLPSIFRS